MDYLRNAHLRIHPRNVAKKSPTLNSEKIFDEKFSWDQKHKNVIEM